LLRFVWAIALIGISIATYKIISQQDKAPSYTFLVNGLPLTGQSPCITVPITNDSYALRFTVVNSGNGPAERLSLHARFPKQLNVTPSGNWEPAGVASFANNRLSYQDTKDFLSDAGVILHTNGYVNYNAITIQESNLNNSVNSMLLVAKALNSARVETPFTIRFTNGVGPARLGL
jgi:hypothetical protein